jgi:NADP-dependent 3-hydroxy acid dehydrogenase YdfG
MKERNSRFFTRLTGAGAGVNRASAVEIDRRGWNLVLVSLANEGFSESAAGLETVPERKTLTSAHL